MNQLRFIVNTNTNKKFHCIVHIGTKKWELVVDPKIQALLNAENMLFFSEFRDVALGSKTEKVRVGYLKPGSLTLLTQGKAPPDDLKISEYEKECVLCLAMNDADFIYFSPLVVDETKEDAIIEEIDELKSDVDELRRRVYSVDVADLEFQIAALSDKIAENSRKIRNVSRIPKYVQRTLLSSFQLDGKEYQDVTLNLPSNLELAKSIHVAIEFQSLPRKMVKRPMEVCISVKPKSGERLKWDFNLSYRPLSPVFRIQSLLNESLCIGISDQSKPEKSLLITESINENDTNQLWYWFDEHLVHFKSGLFLNFQDRNLCLTPENNFRRQTFCQDGFFIHSLFDGRVLDIKGGKSTHKTKIIHHPKHGGKNQQWKLVQVPTPVPRNEGPEKLMEFKTTKLEIPMYSKTPKVKFSVKNPLSSPDHEFRIYLEGISKQ